MTPFEFRFIITDGVYFEVFFFVLQLLKTVQHIWVQKHELNQKKGSPLFCFPMAEIITHTLLALFFCKFLCSKLFPPYLFFIEHMGFGK